MANLSTGLCLAVPVDGKNVPSTIFYKDHHTLGEIEGMIRNKVNSFLTTFESIKSFRFTEKFTNLIQDSALA